MMRKVGTLAAALVLAMLPAGPASAAWKLVPHGAPTTIAKGPLQVTPLIEWNRSSRHPIAKSEIWTIDGVSLNELYFVSGLEEDETLYKDADRKNNPLPRMGAAMQLAEIPEFFESSNRVALGTSVFRITGVSPTQFGGHPGVRFTYEYAVNGSALTRKGVAAGALVDSRLYLISFTAPALYYFDRDRANAEDIMSGAGFAARRRRGK